MKFRKNKKKNQTEWSFVHPLTVCSDPDTGVDAHRIGGTIELLLSCTDLPNLDLFSKSDPMCVLSVKQFGQWRETARTEAVKDCLNPKFIESFSVEYDPELSQPVLFSVYDVDSRSSDLSQHDHVGSVELSLSQLVNPDTSITCTSHALRVPGDSASRGWLNITTEPVRPCKTKALLHLGAIKLEKSGFFSKSTTFLEVARSISSTSFHPVFRSEVFHKSQSPRWRPVELNAQRLCNGDLSREIQLSCWHVHSNTENVLIGETTLTLNDLEEVSKSSHKNLQLRHPKKLKNKRYKRLETDYTMLDFVQGGCDVKFMLAIDFTSSNGDASDPISLHHLAGDTDNQYIEAIKTVGGLLSHYDITQEFITYGFGAKSGTNATTKHCFELTNRTKIRGIPGLLKAYRAAVPSLVFSGPSRVAPVLHAAMLHAKDTSQQHCQMYHVLMIVTDGIINDLDAALDALVMSSSLPLSVVFVAVGPADFTLLDQLEPGGIRSSKYGNPSRHNVHVVALRKQKYTTGVNAKLGRECLAAVSHQMIDCMKRQKITPNKPRVHKTHPGDDDDNKAWTIEAMSEEAENFHMLNSHTDDYDQNVEMQHVVYKSASIAAAVGVGHSAQKFRPSLYRKRPPSVFHRSSSMDALGIASKTSSKKSQDSTLHYSVSLNSIANKTGIGPSCPTCGSAIAISNGV